MADQTVTDQQVASLRDGVVLSVWTNTLAQELEQKLKSETTATGTFYSDLTNLHNQYMTALTVFAKAGITRPSDAPDLSDEDSWNSLSSTRRPRHSTC